MSKKDEKYFKLNSEQLDTSAQKYGQQQKKPKHFSKSKKSEPDKPDKRLSSFNVMVIPTNLLSTSIPSDACKTLPKLIENADKLQTALTSLGVVVRAYGRHKFPSNLEWLVIGEAQKTGIWTSDADVASSDHQWIYVNQTPKTNKISFEVANGKNTPTLSDINGGYGRRKNLIFVSACPGNGIKWKKVEQLLKVSGGISGQTLAEIIENQHKIIHLIKMVLKAVNVEIKGDSVDDIMSVLDLTSASISLSPTKGKSQLFSNDQLYDLLPKFKDLDDIPKCFHKAFFDGWCLVDIYGDGNCLLRLFECMCKMLGIPVSHGQMRTLFHAQIKELEATGCDEFPGLQTLLQNIESAEKDIDIILKDGSYVKDDFMDSFLMLYPRMFKCNILIYKGGKLRMDFMKHGNSFNADYPCGFGIFTGAHWKIGIQSIVREQICPNYRIECELGALFPARMLINICGGCFKKIGSNNATARWCKGCEYLSGVHNKCVGKVVDDPLLLEEDETSFLKCNYCLGTEVKEWDILVGKDDSKTNDEEAEIIQDIN